MSKLDTLLSDYKIGGIIFTSVYVVSTLVIPNLLMLKDRQFKTMDLTAIVIWFAVLITWQLMIIFSIYKYLDGDRGDSYNSYTYKIFVQGGWYNFQKWISYYAENLFGDIILVAFIFILPMKVFDKIDSLYKVQLVFVKIGLFLLFVHFIIGPPKYEIPKGKLTVVNYFNQVLKF